jgi:hypothetical protein
MSSSETANHSARFSLLSFALSTWVEGSSQLRTALLLRAADIPSEPVNRRNGRRLLQHNDLRTTLYEWFITPGRDFDDEEKTAVACLDLVVRALGKPGISQII